MIKWRFANVLLAIIGTLITSSLVLAKHKYTDKPIYGDGKALIGIANQVIDRWQNKDTTATQSLRPRWAYRITFVLPNSAAFNANMQVGDILLSWDEHTLDSVSTSQRQVALRHYLKQHKRIGDSLQIRLQRQSSYLEQTNKQPQPLSKAALEKLLQHPQSNHRVNLSIDYQQRELTQTIILGKRQDDIKLPRNDLLFAPMQVMQSPIQPMLTKVMQQLGNQVAYNDLLQRYADNQKWHQGYRLNRFRYLHRQPEKVLAATEYLAQQMFNRPTQPHDALAELSWQWRQMVQWLDIAQVAPISKIPLVQSAQLNDHWQFIQQVLSQAEQLRQKAFSGLSKEQQQYIQKHLPALLQRFSDSFYINISSQSETNADTAVIHQHNQQLLQLLQKIDYRALIQAADSLQQLRNPQWLQQLQRHRQQLFADQSVVSQNSPFGLLQIASTADHIHHQIGAVTIDLGGNDRYLGTTAGQSNHIIIDLTGNDLYSASLKQAQASAFMGVSLLFDLQGDDDYIGSYFAQAVAIAGVATLVDYAGDDNYWGQRYSQGSALWGIALLHDYAGNDAYHGWLYSQGFAGPMGMGILLDEAGDDSYHATGESQSSYSTTGNFRSSSQGFAAGMRGYASGGLAPCWMPLAATITKQATSPWEEGIFMVWGYSTMAVMRRMNFTHHVTV